MIDSLLMAVHAFVNRVSMSFSVDETLYKSLLIFGRHHIYFWLLL